MFEFWRGVPELVIPDNEKAAVHKASRHEPDLNPTYQELATTRPTTNSTHSSLPTQHAHIRKPRYYTHHLPRTERSPDHPCFANPPSTCFTNSGSRAWPKPSRSRPPCPDIAELSFEDHLSLLLERK